MGGIIESDELDGQEDEEENDDLQNQIADVFEGIGGDDTNRVKCKIYRIENGLYQHLFDEVPGAMHNMETRLRNEGGAGLYEVRVLIGRAIRRRIKVPIAHTIQDKQKPVIDNSMKPDQVLNIVQQMQTQQMDQFKLIMQNMVSALQPPAQPQPAPVNPMEMQSSIMAMMVQMKEFLGGNQSKQVDPIETIGRVVELIPTMQSITGDGAGSTAPIMASLAKEFLPKLMDLAKLQTGAPTPGREAPPTPDQVTAMANQHVAAVTKQSQPQTPTGDKTEMLNNFMVNKALGFLLQAAERNFSTVTYAELLIDQAQIYGMEQEVINFMLAQGVLDKMYAINPKVGQYREWFEHLIQGVSELVTEVSDESGDEAINEPKLTTSTITAINHSQDASHSTEQKPVIANPRRGDGDMDDVGGDVGSG